MTVTTAALHCSPATLPLPCFSLPRAGAIGNVRAITLRPGSREAPRAVAEAAAVAGSGLAGDIHADPLSPRQVLLAGTPAYARHALAPHTLRENLLLDVDTSDFASGTLLRVGCEVVLQLTFACEACGYLDAHAPGLAGRIGRARGMLARVVAGGIIRAGDPIVPWEGSRGPEHPAGAPPITWSDDWRERVTAILARVPAGMAVDYRQLARLAGVQTVYCRAFPRLARSLGLAHAAVSMHGASDVPRWDGRELFGEPE
ncbi:MOSC domain-containing protein [Massilia sp. METH4]|uniref:MOSC domain-containing protein n=1 Tax=Massilia sp. METH4 TaxID=3123041 RepID=UPI0030D3490C